MNNIKIGDKVRIKNGAFSSSIGRVIIIDAVFCVYGIELESMDTYLSYVLEEFELIQPDNIIDWKNIEEKYQYVAMDKNDGWYCYSEKPTTGTTVWQCLGGYLTSINIDYQATDWTTSLVERPINSDNVVAKLTTTFDDTEMFPIGTTVYVDIDLCNTVKKATVLRYRHVVHEDNNHIYEYKIRYDNYLDIETEWVIHEAVFLTSEEAFNA